MSAFTRISSAHDQMRAGLSEHGTARTWCPAVKVRYIWEVPSTQAFYGTRQGSKSSSRLLILNVLRSPAIYQWPHWDSHEGAFNSHGQGILRAGPAESNGQGQDGRVLKHEFDMRAKGGALGTWLRRPKLEATIVRSTLLVGQPQLGR